MAARRDFWFSLSMIFLFWSALLCHVVMPQAATTTPTDTGADSGNNPDTTPKGSTSTASSQPSQNDVNMTPATTSSANEAPSSNASDSNITTPISLSENTTTTSNNDDNTSSAPSTGTTSISGTSTSSTGETTSDNHVSTATPQTSEPDSAATVSTSSTDEATTPQTSEPDSAATTSTSSTDEITSDNGGNTATPPTSEPDSAATTSTSSATESTSDNVTVSAPQSTTGVTDTNVASSTSPTQSSVESSTAITDSGVTTSDSETTKSSTVSVEATTNAPAQTSDGTKTAVTACTPECQNGGVCVRESEKASCLCLEGWSGPGCEKDIDECESVDTYECPSNSLCRNTNGSYTCDCEEGYSQSETTKLCEKIVLWPFYGEMSDAIKIFSDDVKGTDRHHGITFNMSFSYYDRIYNELQIYLDGFVSFGPYHSLSDLSLTRAAWPYSPPVMSVYKSRVTVPSTGGVWLHQEDLSKSANSSLLKQLRERAGNEFEPLTAVVITWIGVEPGNDYPRTNASFQLILASDGQFSYAFMNYDTVWANTATSHGPSVSFAYTGENGQYETLSGVDKGSEENISLIAKKKSPNGNNKACLEAIKDLPDLKLPTCPCWMKQIQRDQLFVYNSTVGDDCFTYRFTSQGYKQRCCYDSDEYLVITGENYPIREDNEKNTFNAAYEMCCVKTTSLCSRFQDTFPDCSTYQVPHFGSGFGDPHITTFDNNRYSFNGWGEYTVFKYTRASDGATVELQGRTTKSDNQNTTRFVAYAFNASDDALSYQIHTDGSGLKQNMEGNVRSAIESQQTIVAHANETLLELISQIGGISVKIIEKSGILTHEISISGASRGSTVGLMGYLDGQADNDFQLSDGTTLKGNVSSLTGEDINKFVESWRVRESQSHFDYEHTYNSNYSVMNDHDGFEPPALPTTSDGVLSLFPENGTKKAEALELCGDGLFCLQDFYSNHNNDSAIDTLKTSKELASKKNILTERTPEFTNSEEYTFHSHGSFKLALKGGSANVTFSMESSEFPGVDITLDTNGTFQWNLSSSMRELRKLSYPRNLAFFANNSVSTARFTPKIYLCLCEKENQCNTDSLTSTDGGQDPKGNVLNLVCNCGNSTKGEYCEETVNKCDNCYNASFCNDSKTEDYCACPDGYTWNGFQCRDINECLQQNGDCEQNCVNTDGSHSCNCSKGFSLEDDTKCKDIDECQTKDTCPGSQECVNEQGSHQCLCFPGRIGDSCAKAPYTFIGHLDLPLIKGHQECSKVLEGKIINSLKHGLHDRTDLIVTLLDFKCPKARNAKALRTTFVVNTGDVAVSAEELNSLLQKTHCQPPDACKFYEIYLNVNPLVDANADICTSLSKCDLVSTNCQARNNTLTCSCKPGFKQAHPLQIYSCVDVDECAGNISSCDQGRCVNTAGSYRCQCSTGEVWNSLSLACEPDSCHNNPCENGGTCFPSSDGLGFTCKCDSKHEGKTCADENSTYARLKVAVIVVGVILGVTCLALFIAVMFLCAKRRRSVVNDHYSNKQVEDYRGLPRPKVKATQRSEMNENGSNYDVISQEESGDKRYTSFGRTAASGPVAAKRSSSPHHYHNKAFDGSDVQSKL